MSFTIKSNKGVPKTGQTIVYQAGDDGTYQKGYPLAGTGARFTDNGDNTITDTLLNVMWIKRPEAIIPTDNGTIGSISPDWATGVSYSVGDVVYFNGSNKSWYSGGSQYPYPGSYCRFRCISAHTSTSFQTDFGNSKWAFDGVYGNDLNQAIAGRSSWSNATDYLKGEAVEASDGSSTYRWVCAVDHTSVASSFTNWANGTIYITGDIRKDNISGVIYILNSAGTGQTSKDFTTYSQGISSFSANDVAYDGSNYYKVLKSTSCAEATLTDDEAANPFTYVLLGNSIDYIFAFDRSLNPTYWSVYVTGTAFANVLVDHPTYWIKDIWISSASNLATQIPMIWSTAITSIEALDYLGHTDWRMPNENEMFSLANFANGDNTTHQPNIDVLFPNITASSYWSSTTPTISTSYAYGVYLGYGGVSAFTNDKSNSNYIMICRDI